MELLIHIIVFTATLIQAAASIGFAMVCAPLLALIDPALVPGPMLVVMCCFACIMAHEGRRYIHLPEFAWLLPGLLLGTAGGAALVLAISRDHLSILLGVVVLIAVAVSALGASVRLHRNSLLAGGTISGVMGMVAGIHGPPLALLYANERPEKSRATIALIFVIACLVTLSALAIAGRFDGEHLVRGLTMVPAAFAALFLARYLKRYLSGPAVRYVMLTISAMSALLLIAKTLEKLP